MNVPLLHVRNLTVSFDNKAVLQGLNLDLQAGQKLALVGESGSGKTVSSLALLQLLPSAQVSGQALLYAQDGSSQDLLALDERSMRQLRGNDVAMIFQEPMTALNPLHRVGDQIAEVLTIKHGLTRQQAWRETLSCLARTGFEQAAEQAMRFPHQLSGGQRQRVLIAMAMASRPRLLLADEPTTALDAHLRVQMLRLLEQLQAETGMSMILITHDLGMAWRFADRVAVLEHGLLVEEGAVQDVFAAPQHPYTRKLLDSRPTRLVADALPDAGPQANAGPQPVVLSAENVVVQYPDGAAKRRLLHWRDWFKTPMKQALHKVGFSLKAGRTLAVIGESGSGKSSLALAVSHLLPCTGTVRVGQQAWTGQTHKDRALRGQLQMVFQDPFSSLSPRMTVAQILAEGLRCHHPNMPEDEVQQRLRKALLDVGMPATDSEAMLQRYPHEFSGGQRQRIALARALVLQPQCLVLDEPTSALDVSVQKQVLELLVSLQEKHQLAYLLITHDVDVVRALAHDVLVLKSGRVIEAGDARSVLANPTEAYTQQLLQASEWERP
jgi:microcin C transport system ATP-binding protein